MKKSYAKLNLTLIHNLKEKIDELKKSEEKYRALIETTDTGYVIIDGKGVVLDANREYVRLTGRKTLDEIKGRSVIEWTAKYDLKRNAHKVKKCFEKGFVRNLEIDYVGKNGKIIPIEVNATVLQTKKTPIIVTLCRDITERKKAEQKLLQQKQKYEKELKAMKKSFQSLNQRFKELKKKLKK